MYKIVEKKLLNPTVTKMVVEAPLVARRAQAGQFIIFRTKERKDRYGIAKAKAGKSDAV